VVDHRRVEFDPVNQRCRPGPRCSVSREFPSQLVCRDQGFTHEVLTTSVVERLWTLAMVEKPYATRPPGGPRRWRQPRTASTHPCLDGASTAPTAASGRTTAKDHVGQGLLSGLRQGPAAYLGYGRPHTRLKSSQLNAKLFFGGFKQS
jgi:hypothetical protein